MENDNHTTWLSVQLFYNEPWEEFLERAIEPYVNTAIQTGIAESYFFIRYWERGPHIRLRLKGNSDMVKTILKPNLEEHFENYFDSIPSQRVDPNYPESFDDNLKWLPNNTIFYNDYIPEINRFGSGNSLKIVEDLFMVSSKAVLELIKTMGKTWSYDDALGNAIKIHIAFVFSAGLNLDQAILFFDFFSKNWLPYTFQQKEENLSSEERIHQEKLSISAFEISFEEQKENLIPFHEIIWNGLNSEDQFEDDLLNNWVEANQQKLDQLKIELQNNKAIQRSEEFQYPIKSSIVKQNEPFWSILADLVHLTNNRLGILNRDESYLTFMIKKCLESLKKNDTSIVSPSNQSFSN